MPLSSLNLIGNYHPLGDPGVGSLYKGLMEGIHNSMSQRAERNQLQQNEAKLQQDRINLQHAPQMAQLHEDQARATLLKDNLANQYYGPKSDAELLKLKLENEWYAPVHQSTINSQTSNANSNMQKAAAMQNKNYQEAIAQNLKQAQAELQAFDSAPDRDKAVAEAENPGYRLKLQERIAQLARESNPLTLPVTNAMQNNPSMGASYALTPEQTQALQQQQKGGGAPVPRMQPPAQQSLIFPTPEARQKYLDKISHVNKIHVNQAATPEVVKALGANAETLLKYLHANKSDIEEQIRAASSFSGPIGHYKGYGQKTAAAFGATPHDLSEAKKFEQTKHYLALILTNLEKASIGNAAQERIHEFLDNSSGWFSNPTISAALARNAINAVEELGAERSDATQPIYKIKKQVAQKWGPQTGAAKGSTNSGAGFGG